MNTETTKTPDEAGPDEVFYDGECPMCSNLAAYFAEQTARESASFVPLQTPGTEESLGATTEELRDLMHVRAADGRVLKGADGIVYLASRRRFGALVTLPFKLPGVMPIARFLYRRVARNRQRLSTMFARLSK